MAGMLCLHCMLLLIVVLCAVVNGGFRNDLCPISMDLVTPVSLLEKGSLQLQSVKEAEEDSLAGPSPMTAVFIRQRWLRHT